jgi:hypothetical protein
VYALSLNPSTAKKKKKKELLFFNISERNKTRDQQTGKL